MGRTAFFLRAYNDLDHIGPVVWTFIKRGDNPMVVFHTAFPYESDYRMQFLESAGDVDVIRELDRDYERFQHHAQRHRLDPRRLLYMLKRDNRLFTQRLYRRFFFNCAREVDFLERNDITRCVFEWGSPLIRGVVIERFFAAAKGLGIPTFCLPHGCNVYTHPDVNVGYRRTIERGRLPDLAARRLYDYYVVQNPLRRDQLVMWGYDPLKTQAWGSARFCPQWQSQNLAICEPFRPAESFDDRLKVVFMHHQKQYNLNQRGIWSLLDRMAREAWIHLIVKQSTRAGTAYTSRAFMERHGKTRHVQIVGNDVHSPALIAWSDCVINFGSSIGMEALLQSKPLLAPLYLHGNRTLFDTLRAALVATSEDEAIAQLKRIRDDRSTNVSPAGRDAIMREVVYGGAEPHDVLESYHRKITAESLAY